MFLGCMDRNRKKWLLIGVGSVVFVFALLTVLFWDRAIAELKAQGYIPYTPSEAQALAVTKCSQCHSTERISKYCFRCGPPLIVVVHNMRTLIRLERAKGKKGIEDYTDAQAVAIAQVWNALVGNWEDTWRRQDIVKLLEGDKALLELLDTPIEERHIEVALSGKMAPGAYRYNQKTPLKPANPSKGP